MTSSKYCVLDLSCGAEELNERIAHAQEPYLAFAEQGASYPDGYFAELAVLLESHQGSDCHIASGSLCAGDPPAPLSLEARFPQETAVLNADEDFSHALVYPYGSICETALLRESGLCFSNDLRWERDTLFALQLSQLCPLRVFAPALRYRSPHAFEELTNNQPQTTNSAWYSEATMPLLEQLRSPETGKLPKQTQYGILYLLEKRFEANADHDVKMVFEGTRDVDVFLSQCGQIMREIHDEVLFCGKPALYWDRAKLLYLASLRAPDGKLQRRLVAAKNNVLMYIDGPGSPKAAGKLGSYRPKVQAMRYRHKADGAPYLDIDFRMAPIFEPESFDIYFRTSYKDGSTDTKAQYTPRVACICTFFDRVATEHYSYHIDVPLAPQPCAQSISAYALCEGERVPLKIAFSVGWQTRLITNDEHAYWHVDGYLIRSRANCIELEPADKAQVQKAERAYFKDLRSRKDIDPWVAKIRKLFFRTRRYFKNKRIWVYYDKGFKAGDNAEFAFRYASAQDDGIEHVYFIEPDTPDGRRLRNAGFKTLAPRSRKGRLYALNAEVIFGTHYPIYRKTGMVEYRMEYLKGLVDPIVIRMYHGFPLTRSVTFTQYYSDFAAVVAASKYEAELYTSPDHGFLPEQVIKTSNPRYDGLVPESRKQLLIAPSWRPSLVSEVNKDGTSSYNPAFKDSVFYQRYAQVLSDPRLLETARACGYHIVVFLHPRLAVQTVDFEQNDVVRALNSTKDAEYVEVMRQSDLMVSDYSSVTMDFAYMRKPVVYYQDPALPYWRTITFDYARAGIGDVCTSTDELVDVLCAYMENGCEITPQRRKCIDEFFFNDDRNGAKRVYEAVRKLVDERRQQEN